MQLHRVRNVTHRATGRLQAALACTGLCHPPELGHTPDAVILLHPAV